MIKHIVLWKLRGAESERQGYIDTFTKNTEYLKSILPQIRKAEIGGNFNEGDGFHIGIYCEFDNRADLDAYLNHPEHLKIRAYINSVTYDKTVFDYEI